MRTLPRYPVLGSLALALALAAGAGTALAQSTTTTTTTRLGAGTAIDTNGSMPMPMEGSLNGMAPKTKLSKADRMFMTMANQGNMTEIAASKLVATMGTSEATRTFAEQMITDHTAANEKLMGVAGTEGLALSEGLDAKHKAEVAMLAKKKRGAAFDKAYVAAMLKDHEMTVKMFQKTANDAKCPAPIRQYATETLPTLQEHLTRIQEIHAEMMKG